MATTVLGPRTGTPFRWHRPDSSGGIVCAGTYVTDRANALETQLFNFSVSLQLDH